MEMGEMFLDAIVAPHRNFWVAGEHFGIFSSVLGYDRRTFVALQSASKGKKITPERYLPNYNKPPERYNRARTLLKKH